MPVPKKNDPCIKQCHRTLMLLFKLYDKLRICGSTWPEFVSSRVWNWNRDILTSSGTRMCSFSLMSKSSSCKWPISGGKWSRQFPWKWSTCNLPTGLIRHSILLSTTQLRHTCRLVSWAKLPRTAKIWLCAAYISWIDIMLVRCVAKTRRELCDILSTFSSWEKFVNSHHTVPLEH